MSDVWVTEGSGNVFLDLGLDDAEALFAQTGLAIEIQRIFAEGGWSEAEVPAVTGVDEAAVADLLAERFDHLSIDSLLRILSALGHDVDMVVEPTAHEWGRGGLFVRRGPGGRAREERFRYPTEVRWSEEDEAFILRVPDLPGCMADGATRRAAFANLEQVIRNWIETAVDLGRPIPIPGSRVPGEAKDS